MTAGPFATLIRPFINLHPNATEVIVKGHDLVSLGGSVGEYAFTATQTWTFIGFAIGLYILRNVLAVLWFIPLGRKLVGDHRPVFVDKWVENCWFCVYYPISFALGMYVCFGEDFFSDPYYYYVDFPILSTGHRANTLFMVYYAMGFGFYLQSIVALVTFETRRKDFWVMFVHHLATITLMSVSWATAHDRIGSMVLLLHDFVDIFLYVGKALHYIKAEKAKTVAFVLFAIAYFCARMVFFPFRIIYSVASAAQCCQGAAFLIMYNPASKYFGELSTFGLCVGHYCFSMWWFLTGFMTLLYALHVFWFSIIVKMIYQALVDKGIKQDARSDSEDEALAQEEENARKLAAASKKGGKGK